VVKKTIYYMYKPGEVRDYAMTTPPSPAWSIAMAKEGFKLFECLVDIPMEEAVVLEGYGDEVGPAHGMCFGCKKYIGDGHSSDCQVYLSRVGG
jgi:hypothetical protein